MRPFALIALAAVFPVCLAQTGQPAQLALKQMPSATLMVIGADGSAKKAPDGTTLRLQTEVLSDPEKVGDVLRRNGLKEDAQTVGMLKRLNPGQDFRSGEVPAGTKLDIFVPKWTYPAASPTATGMPVTFDNQLVAKWAVRDEVARTADLKKFAFALSPKTYEDKPTLVAHRQLVSDIDNAAKIVATKANGMTAADLAVAQYQIKYASLRAEAANRNATLNGKLTSEDVAQLRKAAAPTQEIAIRLSAGQSPLPLRRVKVNVLEGDTEKGVKGLQVYVLPTGILDNLSSFTEDEVRNYLTRFSFLDETSPSTGNVAIFDTSVWVGPRLRFREMAKLAHDGGLSKVRPIDDPLFANPSVELTFRSPADVVQP